MCRDCDYQDFLEGYSDVNPYDDEAADKAPTPEEQVTKMSKYIKERYGQDNPRPLRADALDDNPENGNGDDEH